MAKKRYRWLSNVSYDALRRASPAENVRMGFTPARRYVSANGRKVIKSTRSISARQAETRRVRERYGMASPEIATEARKRGRFPMSRRIKPNASRRRPTRANQGEPSTRSKIWKATTLRLGRRPGASTAAACLSARVTRGAMASLCVASSTAKTSRMATGIG